MKENEIVEGFKELYSGAIADVMCAMGYRAVMDPSIRPIYPDIKMCGRALTVKTVQSSHGDSSLWIEVKETCKPGDVIVIDIGGYIGQTIWGDNSAAAIKVRGAAGTVIDGACRDIAELRRMQIPTYCKAFSPGMQKDTIWPTAYNVTVTCGGVQVKPRDIIFGDDTGIVVIPEEIAHKVLEKTKKFVEMDSKVKELLLKGKSVKEAYDAKTGWKKIINP